MSAAEPISAPRERVRAIIQAHARSQPSPYSDAKNDAQPSPTPAPTAAASTVAGILEAWTAEGPLVHEPTGIATLDELTGGGPVYGSRWYLLGAPDAGKTALLVQWADRFLERGLAVGLLCVDEEPGDVVTRFMQRRGIGRAECEQRDLLTLGRMRDAAAELAGLRLYDPSWTIERAAADLAEIARSQGRRAFLGVDSIQTVTCAAELSAARPPSIREAVSARASAVRASATQHRMIVMATSEMSRGAYRTVEAAESTDDLASAKESGAIEYSARVMLAMRSVADEADLLELRVAKNKHGRRGDRIGLRLDRRLLELIEADLPDMPTRANAKEETRLAFERDKNTRAAVALVEVLVEHGPISKRDVAPLLRVKMSSCSAQLAEVAVRMLEGGVHVEHGPNRVQALHLDGQALPAPIVAQLEGDLRSRALAARPRMAL